MIVTNEQIARIIEAIEILSKETDVEGKEIIDLLTGFCWDEPLQHMVLDVDDILELCEELKKL